MEIHLIQKNCPNSLISALNVFWFLSSSATVNWMFECEHWLSDTGSEWERAREIKSDFLIVSQRLRSTQTDWSCLDAASLPPRLKLLNCFIIYYVLLQHETGKHSFCFRLIINYCNYDITGSHSSSRGRPRMLFGKRYIYYSYMMQSGRAWEGFNLSIHRLLPEPPTWAGRVRGWEKHLWWRRRNIRAR